MLAAIIPVDNKQPIRLEQIEATALQSLVGGDVQLVGIRQLGMNVYINENAKLEGLPLNFRATVLCHTAEAIFPDDVINGDAVLLGPVDDEEGEDTGLSDAHVAFLERFGKGTAGLSGEGR